MRNSLAPLALLALVAAALLSPAESAGQAVPAASPARMEKNSAKECAICHISWIDAFFFEGRTTDLSGRPPADAAASEEMCFSCHNGSLVDSRERVWGGRGHPVNKKPLPGGPLIPRELPLGKDGRLVCATCHSAHSVADNTRFEQVIFLRVANKTSELCQLCHRDRAGGAHAGNHSLHKAVDEATRRRLEKAGARFDAKGGIICESCHAAHGGLADHMLVLSDEGPDGRSELCEACHGVNPARDNRTDASRSHPVGLSASPTSLPAAWDNGEKVRTGQGRRILCVTCHRMHSAARDTALLVRPVGEGLCLQCHPDQSSVSGTKHDLSVLGPELQEDARDALKRLGSCGPCHAVHGAQGPRLWARPIPAEPGADGVSRLCLSCHRKGGPARERAVKVPLHSVGHPAPDGMQVDGLPLFGKDGSRTGSVVSCATCHDVHRWDSADPAHRPGKQVRGDASTSFLRHPDSSASSLCLRCHAEKELVRGTVHDSAVVPAISQGKRVSLCGPCHVVHGAKGNRLWAREIVAPPEVDRISAICLSCHGDGGMAPAKPGQWEGHPVRQVVPETMEVEGLPLFEPDGTLRGRGVTCATCHDVHRWDPVDAANRPGKKAKGDDSTSFLRISNAQTSRLCLNCHRDKESIAQTPHDPAVVPALRQGKSDALCGGCHTAHGAKGTRLWAAEVPARAGQDPVSTLCLLCHGEGGMAKSRSLGPFAHPVGKEAPGGMDVGGLPLFGTDGGVRGRVLTCATCHDAHRWDPSDPSHRPAAKTPGDGSTDFLRKPSSGGAPLCAACHAAQSRVAGTQHDRSVSPSLGDRTGVAVASPGLCSPCHRTHEARQAHLLWPSEIETGASADRAGPYCRSCHRKDGLAEKKLPGEHQHPVGVQWRGEAVRLPLASDAAGQATIITCTTCHDPHGGTPSTAGGEPPERRLLRHPPPGESNLCGACHARQTPVADTPHDPARMKVLLGGEGSRDRPSTPCTPCHSIHAPQSPFLLWDGPIGTGTDAMTRLCTGCHLDEKLLRRKAVYLPLHPQNVVITGRGMALRGPKADFPLFDKDGKRTPSGIISCPTCHDPHRWDAADPSIKPAAGDRGSAINDFLRNKGATFGFCSDCHSIRALLFYKNFHDPREWQRKGK